MLLSALVCSRKAVDRGRAQATAIEGIKSTCFKPRFPEIACPINIHPRPVSGEGGSDLCLHPGYRLRGASPGSWFVVPRSCKEVVAWVDDARVTVPSSNASSTILPVSDGV